MRTLLPSALVHVCMLKIQHYETIWIFSWHVPMRCNSLLWYHCNAKQCENFLNNFIVLQLAVTMVSTYYIINYFVALLCSSICVSYVQQFVCSVWKPITLVLSRPVWCPIVYPNPLYIGTMLLTLRLVNMPSPSANLGHCFALIGSGVEQDWLWKVCSYIEC